MRAVQLLRSGGCYVQHLELEGAVDELVVDWHAALVDLSDEQLRIAASTHLESEDGRKWPTKFDLREALKQASSRHPTARVGCDACDQTGMRELIRIDAENRRMRAVAACDCPKGQAISNPPTMPPNAPGRHWKPPESFHAVVAAWKRQGFDVLVASADEPHFALSEYDTSETTRERLAAARATPGGVLTFVPERIP